MGARGGLFTACERCYSRYSVVTECAKKMLTKWSIHDYAGFMYLTEKGLKKLSNGNAVAKKEKCSERLPLANATPRNNLIMSGLQLSPSE